MAVYKRGGQWWTEFRFHGQRIQKATGAPTKAKARAVEAKFRADQHERHVLGRAQEMTFGEATDHYVETNIKARRKGQDGEHRHGTKLDLAHMKRLEEFFGVDTPLPQVVAPARIAEFKKKLLETRKPSSANRVLNLLRAILMRALKDGGLNRAPIIESFKANDARERFLNEKEELALIASCPDYLKRLVIFFLDTGARREEAISLTWDQVTLHNAARGSVTFTDTKSGKPRTVFLPKRTADMLASIRPDEPKKGARVFLWTPLGSDVAVPFNDPKKAWATARKAAKLGDLRIHDLRHTYASKLIKKRVPLYEISKLLGHGSLRMTERYSHLANEQLENAVSVLD